VFVREVDARTRADPRLRALEAEVAAAPPADQAALRLVMARLDIGRPFFVPPGVPADRVAALRKAFDDTMKDSAYLEEAKKLKIDVDPLTGAELATLVEQVSKTPADTVARVRAALENK